MKIPRLLSTMLLPAAFLLLLAHSLFSQEPAKEASRDYSAEPSVVEKLVNRIKFENDGTSTMESEFRIRIQSASGVQDWGLIQLPYASSNSEAEITSVKVTKSDGTVVETPADSAQETPAQITIAAPSYSDLKVKQLAVKGLDIGSILELQDFVHTKSPLIPDQFWFAQDFFRAAVVLKEELQISVPRSRYVKVKSPSLAPKTTEANGYVIYTWETANQLTKAERDKADKEKANGADVSGTPFADVQITSFRSWDEIAQWYKQLESPRSVPTSEIRAKAEELTRNATSEEAKIRALYSFVATKFRYIGVSFGIGRYQPHAASDVFSNGYGDCKDKHTLLAALLAAVGIKAYPALVNSSLQIDPDIPAPNQFDHLITVIPQGDALVWLDTTSEIAPFGVLIPSLRDKQALVIAENAPGELKRTPENLPFKQTTAFHIEGKMSSTGTLDGQVTVSARGDVELLLRSAFHRSSQAEWKDVTQAISRLWGFAGTVDDLTVSSPEAIDAPLSLKYSYSRKDYPNWPDVYHSPLPEFNLRELQEDDKSSGPITLEVPGEYLADASIEIPPGLTPRVRPPVDAKTDFAEYHASYSFDSHVLHTERHLTVLKREIPRSQSEAYKAFQELVANDLDSVVALTASTTPPAAPSTTDRSGKAEPDAEAERLVAVGSQLFVQDDYDAAATEYRKALALQPDNASTHRLLADVLSYNKDYDGAVSEYHEALRLRRDFPEALRGLGLVLYDQDDFDGAITQYREALRLKSDDQLSLRGLADSLWMTRDYPAAANAYREALLLAKDDPELHYWLAEALSYGGDLDGAIPEYREAARLKPDLANVHARLGVALMRKGPSDEAVTELGKASAADPKNEDLLLQYASAEILQGNADNALSLLRERSAANPSPSLLSGIAFELTHANVHLEEALDYAQRGVSGQEAGTSGITLTGFKPVDSLSVFRMAPVWDTLGWAHFLLGHLPEAERYLTAAWNLWQTSITGSHLGRLYEKTGDQKQAIHYYAMAASADGPPDDALSRLAALLGSKAQADQEVKNAKDALMLFRTVKLPRLVQGPAPASTDLLVLYSGGHVTDVKFLRGADQLQTAAVTNAIESADHLLSFPDDAPTKIFRRGIVDCAPSAADCTLVYFPMAPAIPAD